MIKGTGYYSLPTLTGGPVQSHWCGCIILLSKWSKDLRAKMQPTMNVMGKAEKGEQCGLCKH